MKPLRILIDARGTQEGFKQHKHRGIGHYAAQLIRHLLASDTRHRLTFLIDTTLPVDPLLAGADLLHHKPWTMGTAISGFLEAQLSLPRTLRGQRFDAVHFLAQHDGSIGTPLPFILNVLDTVQQSAGHLYSFTQKTKHRIIQSILRRTIRKAEAVITISEYSKEEIVRHYGTDREKIHVTHLAADRRFFLSQRRNRNKSRFSLRVPREFLLYVGGIDPRKNVPTLIRALAILYREHPKAPPLVFAGRIDNQAEYESLMAQINSSGLQHAIHFLGYVPEELLPELYRRSTLFVFPSLLEGFGLPVVQALASGTPVIASATSSIPEVAGSAAFYATMTSAEDLARVIAHVLTHPREVSRKVAEGRRRARTFSWEQTARATIRVYEIVCAHRHG